MQYHLVFLSMSLHGEYTTYVYNMAYIIWLMQMLFFSLSYMYRIFIILLKLYIRLELLRRVGGFNLE